MPSADWTARVQRPRWPTNALVALVTLLSIGIWYRLVAARRVRGSREGISTEYRDAAFAAVHLARLRARFAAVDQTSCEPGNIMASRAVPSHRSLQPSSRSPSRSRCDMTARNRPLGRAPSCPSSGKVGRRAVMPGIWEMSSPRPWHPGTTRTE